MDPKQQVISHQNTGKAMAEVQEVQLVIKETSPLREVSRFEHMPIDRTAVPNEPGTATFRNYLWWVKVAIYSLFALLGQTVAILLGRQYFQEGGSSKWLESLVQTAGFPILIPIYFYLTSSKFEKTPSASIPARALIYISFGATSATATMLSVVALKYLPVSTFALISATPLAFTAFFAFFINAQKFTPLIINSLFLLIIASILLVIDVGSGQGSTKAARGKYVIGFICALACSALTGLIVNLMQLAFRKVLKGNPLKVIFELQICNSAVASVIYVIGLFASREWKTLEREKRGFGPGEVSYVMNLVWTAISGQVGTICIVGLVYEVSSVFGNVISVLGLPIVPIVAVFLFHEKMTSVKAIALILSVWGFISYIYQHYLDDRSLRTEQQITSTDLTNNARPEMENTDPSRPN